MTLMARSTISCREHANLTAVSAEGHLQNRSMVFTVRRSNATLPPAALTAVDANVFLPRPETLSTVGLRRENACITFPEITIARPFFANAAQQMDAPSRLANTTSPSITGRFLARRHRASVPLPGPRRLHARSSRPALFPDVDATFRPNGFTGGRIS